MISLFFKRKGGETISLGTILFIVTIVAGFVFRDALPANATSAGPRSPTTATNNTSLGTISWSSPNNVFLSDNQRATVILSNDQISNYLVATGFDFSAIPDNATITGILVNIERSEEGLSTRAGIFDYAVHIVQGGTISATENKADISTAWPNSANENYASYGGVADLWGISWTTAQIKSANFGVAISAQNRKISGHPAGANESARIDHITITVEYSVLSTNEVTVGATLTQPANATEGATGIVMGVFTFLASSETAAINSIKISEKGTVNANVNLSNIKLYAQEESVCTFSGSVQIGTTQQFSGADEATIGSLNLPAGTAVPQCVFVVLDVGSSAGSGNTIEIEITAAGDVAITNGTPAGVFPVQIDGTTIIRTGMGTVISTEIDFDWVSGQTGWGEIIWSTSEPEGDVKIRVRYTMSAPCDTLIPDLDLSGNSIGFDASVSPLNISSLDTITYNRICLEATLIAGVSAAPTLNDWAITWGAPAGGYAPLGTYISSPFDTGTPSAFTAIEWNWSKTNPACASCAIRFQIQTAPDAGGTPGAWTPTWAGPEGNDGDETDYFTLSTGEIIHKNHNGNQWVRYRATLDGDGADTPVLEEVRIFYQLQI